MKTETCPLCEKARKIFVVWEGTKICAVCYDTMFPPLPGSKNRKGEWVLGSIKTEKQFKKHMKETAQDAINDGLDLDSIAPDLADSLFHNPDIKAYVLKNNPWIKTKTQWREFVADWIVG